MSFAKTKVASFCILATVFLSGVIVGSGTNAAALSAQVAAQGRAQETTKLMTTDLAGWCDGKEIVVEYHEEGPGPSSKHYHPGHSFSYMIEGSRTVTVDGMPVQVVRAGEIHYEAPMRANISNNASAAKVVTFRIMEKGKTESVVVP
jgi:hypothetical protein